MRFCSYWRDSAPAFADGAQGPVEGDYDVAVIGGGFTGLSAARTLARGGARVAVLEADAVGSGASGRNGGHVNNGLAHSYVATRARFGRTRAAALYRAFDDAVGTVERIVADEAIDCGFRRGGKLKLASKPAHFEALRVNQAAIRAEADPDVELLGPSELAAETSAPAYGAMLSPGSGMMHMGAFTAGLAGAASRAGAAIFERAAVTGLRPEGAGRRIVTARGALTAREVLVATGAYTSGPFAAFRRRIVPVGSFLIATAPLTDEQIAQTLPGDRNYVTSMNVGNYFRLTDDRRLIFGGRARFSARADQRSDAQAGAILARAMAGLFPQLADLRIDYCWGGLVDMTRDRFPRAGRMNGLHFAMGYAGHGVHMSVHMGEVMADILLGRPDRNPFRDMAWPAIPLYAGTPWFLPVAGLWYRWKDLIS